MRTNILVLRQVIRWVFVSSFRTVLWIKCKRWNSCDLWYSWASKSAKKGGYDDDDYSDMPPPRKGKKGGYDDDDDDDFAPRKPAKKSRFEDDDDDDFAPRKPAKKSRFEDDDDDDFAPRKPAKKPMK